MVDSVGVTVVSVRAVKSTSPGSRVSESKFEADHVRELEAPAEIAAGVAIRLLILGRSESEVRVRVTASLLPDPYSTAKV